MQHHRHQVDFLRPFKPNLFVFKLFGILLPEKSAPNYKTALLRAILLWFLEIPFMLTQLVYLILNFDDAKEITEVSYLLITCLTNTGKKLTNLKNIETVKAMLHKLNCDIFQPLNEKQEKLAIDEGLVSLVIHWIYSSMGVIMCGLWVFAVAFGKERRIPFNAWFPGDYLKTPWYEAICVYQMTVITYEANLCINSDTFTIGLLRFIGVQCDYLADTLENLQDHGQKNMDKMLKRCVEHHRSIKMIKEQMQSIYDISIFLQFVGSTVVLCSTMFQATRVPLFSNEFFSMGFYQAGSVFQIFIYCWFGNEVIFKSNKISESAFKLHWLECGESFKKSLTFFITNSQQPFIVIVAGIFQLSVQTFILVCRILRSSFSYFAVLNSIDG